jgi:hypothetical protein
MVHGPGTLRAGDPGIETPVSVYLRPTPGRPPKEAEALRLFIRSKLNDGRLPYNSMPRFWGGPGDGATCDTCDTRITNEQLVMEGIAERRAPKS